MAGQISEQACDGAHFSFTVCAHFVHQHWQHALLLQSHSAQHWSPLQDKKKDTVQIQVSLWFFAFDSDKCATHSLVSSCDVLHSPGSCFTGGGVNLTLLQHAVVHAYYLRVPQPLCALWNPGNLSECAEILVSGLPGEGTQKKVLTWTSGPYKTIAHE